MLRRYKNNLKAIIKFYEETRFGTTRDVINHIKGKKASNSEITSVYRSMALLREDKIIVPSPTRNLYKGSVPDSQLPTYYTLDHNSKKYLEYKKRKS